VRGPLALGLKVPVKVCELAGGIVTVGAGVTVKSEALAPLTVIAVILSVPPPAAGALLAMVIVAIPVLGLATRTAPASAQAGATGAVITATGDVMQSFGAGGKIWIASGKVSVQVVVTFKNVI